VTNNSNTAKRINRYCEEATPTKQSGGNISILRNDGRKAFTLPEALMTIAILGVIAVCTVPVFTKRNTAPTLGLEDFQVLCSDDTTTYPTASDCKNLGKANAGGYRYYADASGKLTRDDNFNGYINLVTKQAENGGGVFPDGLYYVDVGLLPHHQQPAQDAILQKVNPSQSDIRNKQNLQFKSNYFNGIARCDKNGNTDQCQSRVLVPAYRINRYTLATSTGYTTVFINCASVCQDCGRSSAENGAYNGGCVAYVRSSTLSSYNYWGGTIKNVGNWAYRFRKGRDAMNSNGNLPSNGNNNTTSDKYTWSYYYNRSAAIHAIYYHSVPQYCQQSQNANKEVCTLSRHLYNTENTNYSMLQN